MKKIILIFFGFSVFSYAQDLKKETEKKQFPAEVQSQNLKEILEIKIACKNLVRNFCFRKYKMSKKSVFFLKNLF